MPKYLYLLFIFMFQPAFSGIQYRPTASPLYHSLSGGLSMGPFEEGKNPFSIKGLFLTYNYYFTNLWLPEKYKGYLLGGLELKAGLDRRDSGCAGYQSRSLPLQAGVKLRLVYWEKVQPFVGVGWMKAFCQKDFKIFKSSSAKPQYIFPFGVSMSLKILDSAAVYSLDEDYGLNDLSLLAQCFRIKTQKESKARLVCEVGLEALF